MTRSRAFSGAIPNLEPVDVSQRAQIFPVLPRTPTLTSRWAQGAIRRAQALYGQQQQQQAQQRADRQKLAALKPSVTADTAAGNVVLYGQQVQADAASLQRQGIIDGRGDLIVLPSCLEYCSSVTYVSGVSTTQRGWVRCR